MGNLIAVSAIFMTPAWFSHFSVLFFSTLCFSTRKRSNRSRFYSSPLLSSSSSSSLQLQLLKLVTGFSAKHPQYIYIHIYRERHVYISIYTNLESWELFLLLLLLPYLIFFAHGQRGKCLRSVCSRTVNQVFPLSYKNKNNDVRNPKICLPPIVWQIIDVRLFGSALQQVFRKFEDVGINCPQVDTSRDPWRMYKKICQFVCATQFIKDRQSEQVNWNQVKLHEDSTNFSFFWLKPNRWNDNQFVHFN